MFLRRAVDSDYDRIFQIHADAFRSAPGAPDPAEAQLVSDLRADGSAIVPLSQVAELDGEIVGHVMCSRGTVDDSECAALGPIAVAPSVQRHGIGTALVHAVLAAADALDEPAVVLLGDPHFYRRFGFVTATRLGVTPPDPNWTDHFQIRTLSAWDGTISGMFKYPTAFDGL